MAAILVTLQRIRIARGPGARSVTSAIRFQSSSSRSKRSAAIVASVCAALREPTVEGMAQPIVGLMIMGMDARRRARHDDGRDGIHPDAGVAGYKAHLAGGGYVAAAFVICCVVSTLTATILVIVAMVTGYGRSETQSSQPEVAE